MCVCGCGFSWVVRWWSCLRHASSNLLIWNGKRCAELDCSRTYSVSIQVCMQSGGALLQLFAVILILWVCFLQWHGFIWLDLLWMVWAAGAATLICVWFWREMWVFLTLHPECHPKHVFVQSLMTVSCLNTCFGFRKDKILFSYCLASKSCSNHCVSSKNPFFFLNKY